MNWPQTKFTQLLGLDAPIVQGGMVWVSGAQLAAAAANAGCLGLLGAGSMSPEILKEQIKKTKSLTQKKFGVNIPLLYEKAKEQIQVALDEGVRIFFTSAGSPKSWTPFLKKEGCIVVHVVSNPLFALKSEQAGVDAVVVEGFEAGGHNGRDELTTLVLLQQLHGKLSIPIVAAGGFGSGESILAALILGADAVQMGTVFAATTESTAHENFKSKMVEATYNSTFLRMKKHVPVRLLDNKFSQTIAQVEDGGANAADLKKILGKGRAKSGMFEGNIDEGELEIGQIVSQVHNIPSCSELVSNLNKEYLAAVKKLHSFKL